MKKIRYGVMGIKRAGLRHISAALENDQVKLVALVDVDEELVKSKSAELGVEGFTDYRDMLAKGMVDAVSIATPNYLHYSMGLECLKAGVHIFVEKPFSTRISEADALVEMAKKHSLKLAVNYHYRTFRSPQLLNKEIQSGTIGQITRILWTWGHLKLEDYYINDPWRGTFQQSGGGLLMSNGSHELDLIRWLIGEPMEVSAFIGNQLHNAEIEDMVCANVLFTNGAFGSLQFTGNQPPGYSVRQIAGHKGTLILPDLKSLYGDKHDQIMLGTYQAPLGTMVHHLKKTPGPSTTTWQSIPKLETQNSILRKCIKLKHLLGGSGRSNHSTHVSGDSLLMNSFIDAILHGGEPLVSGESARSTVEFINGIFLSAMRRKTVRFPLDPEEYDQLFEEMVSGKVRVPRYR